MSLPIWSKYGRIYSINSEIARYRCDYDSLYLTEREIGAFSKIMIEKFHYFNEKESENNSVDITRIIAKIKLNSIPFHVRIFSMFDRQQEGSISFHNLLILIWNLCTIDILLLGYLLFDIYDLDQNGTFEYDEVRLLIAELCEGTDLNTTDSEVKL